MEGGAYYADTTINLTYASCIFFIRRIMLYTHILFQLLHIKMSILAYQLLQSYVNENFEYSHYDYVDNLTFTCAQMAYNLQ